MLDTLPHRELVCGFLAGKGELLSVVSPEEKTIIENFLRLKRGEVSDFDKMSEELFAWAQNKLN